MRSVHRVVVGLVVGFAALALAGCAPAPAPTTPVVPGGALPPRTIPVQGKSVPYQGVQPFESPSVSSREARTLTIFATGATDRGGGPCGPPAIRILTEESATTVRVLVADYEERTSPTTACAAIGYGPTPHAVTLREPLGQRTLIDAANGARPHLLDGSTLPDLPRPPAHFAPSAIHQMEHAGIVTRSWSWTTNDANDWPRLMLLSGDSADLTRLYPPVGKIVEQLPLRGASATIYRDDSNGYPEFVVQWSPNPQQTLDLQLSGKPGRPWTLDDAVRLSRSVTGYRSSTAEQPLPPAKTPGTVAAVYRSTDGTVTRAPNLLKSSGVWVGLECAGIGRVAVTLRDRTTTWSCTTQQSAHMTESLGRPDETFFLTVKATAGVRWTVTLARASLDGS